MLVWRYLDEAGREIGTSERFDDRTGAESWLSEAWTDLHDDGVEEVVLFDDEQGEPLYRMGLEAGTS